MQDADRKQLQALSNHLREHRDTLLERWREAVRRDPELTTSATLSGPQLDDHIPKVLQDFEHRLRAEHALEAAHVDIEQRRDAAKHGMHRWQQGYDIRETMREWGHLQSIVLGELDRYAEEHPQLERGVIPTARESLCTLSMEGICESAARYVRLQQSAAAGRVRDLETSLNALQVLENERAALLRETAHDLRGSVGVIANATALLARTEASTVDRGRFYDLLQQRIQSMGALLTDLVELARLEAGQDPLNVEAFDAAERIRECCDLLRPLAGERGLFLKCEGPGTLPVEGDVLKLQRIAQNLLLNALKATERGGIVVKCSVGSGAEGKHWVLCVQDTGPGFALQSASRLRHALKRATQGAHENDSQPAASKWRTGAAPARNVLPSACDPCTAALPSGEGIGLSIVKRLCEVLRATIELQTAREEGTTIRILFPLRYVAGSASRSCE
ncbi:MAG: sensor histidine kinase [Steroidobacteraceae bacterium]